MLQVENVAKSYGGDPVLENVSFAMQRRERLGLVGRNGSGKSTLFRIITGQESSDDGTVNMPKGYRLGYLDQHVSFSEPTILEEALLGLPPEEREQHYRVEALLFGLGFKQEDMSRSPDEFSGGYQLRLHLTKVLASEPDCLLLDEPTNYLDVVSIRWLTRFLKSWPNELVVISHDRAFMDAITTHTMAIHRHKIVKLRGSTQAVYDHIIEQEELHEKQRQKIERHKSHLQDFIRRFGAKNTKAKQAKSKEKAIGRLPSLEKLAAIEDLDFTFRSAPFTGRMVLNASNLRFRYPDMTEDLITGVNLSIENGETLAIIGKNGRGKSTLLHLLAEELRPSSGDLRIWENVKIGFFGQRGIEKLDPARTVEEEVQAANPNLNMTEVRNICGMMMFSGDSALKQIKVLSGGEKSRVLLGRILASECNLLLLDEPTNHLDMESVEALATALEMFPGTSILVTHSEELLHRLPERLVICHEGDQQVFGGDYADFLAKIGWEEAEQKPEQDDKVARKERKQQRALLVQERAQKLRPLKKQIETLEKQIIAAEEQIESSNEKLLAATQNGDNTVVASLSRDIGQAQKQVDELFEELEKLSSQAVAIEKNYEDLL